MILNLPRPNYVNAHRILELESVATLTLDVLQTEQTALPFFTI